MKLSLSHKPGSILVKVGAIAILIIVLLIPLGMIKGIVLDRLSVASQAEFDIQTSWGGEQVIAGPVMRLPFVVQRKTAAGEPYDEEHVVFLLAERLEINADVDAQMRYRGIHEIPVYAANVSLTGRFDLGELAALDVSLESILWDRAELLLGVSDVLAVATRPRLSAYGTTNEFRSAQRQITGLPPQLAANIADAFAQMADEDGFDFSIELTVNGTESLRFLPLADTSTVDATSNWSSPSFVGRRLPFERTVDDTGFNASWRTTSLARNMPTAWTNSAHVAPVVKEGIFGVRFMQPIGLYQLMFRALTYGVMFVGLTFVTYFLIEVIAKLRLHPLQYLLVGLANSLFYLLLLSLAEHLGFATAYALSSVASATLIVGYSATILASWRRAGGVAVVLVGLYAFLYLTLTAETFALLTGRIALWGVLGIMMYLTRNIDWYANPSD